MPHWYSGAVPDLKKEPEPALTVSTTDAFRLGGVTCTLRRKRVPIEKVARHGIHSMTGVGRRFLTYKRRMPEAIEESTDSSRTEATPPRNPFRDGALRSRTQRHKS